VSSRYPAWTILALSAFRAASAPAAGPIASGAGRVEAEPPAMLPDLPTAEVVPRRLPDLGRPRAVARFQGKAAAGATVMLSGGGSTGSGLRFRWVQTSGPSVVLDDPQGQTASFTVPEQAEAIGFLLVAANGVGLDSASVTVPVQGPASGEASEDNPRAVAGDDASGTVGRRVTLDGDRSEPRGRLGYRWLQLGGPKVRTKREDGSVFSFVPAAPGTYRFALVVAVGGVISEPDTVTVTVVPPAAPTALPGRSAEAAAIDEAARAALASVPGGAEASSAMAGAFAGVADRMDLYRSYLDIFQELTGRIGPILPTDPARRAAWDERLFAPLTARLIEALRAEGLDLRQPEGQRAELTAGQRTRLAEQFRGMAEGFRATSPPG